jgi:hypothetical protein
MNERRSLRNEENMAATKELDALLDETEVIERLPRLTAGDYVVNIEATDYREFSNGTVIELTVVESEGDGAMEPGTRASAYVSLEYTKDTAPYAAKRIKGFAIPALGRKDVKGAEIENLMKSPKPGPFAGKQLRVSVMPSVNKRTGEVKLNPKTGEAYTDLSWSAA